MSSRDQILNKLKAGLLDVTPVENPTDRETKGKPIDADEFIKQLELANTEVCITDKDHWPTALSEVIEGHQIKTLMASQQKLPEVFENLEQMGCSVVDLFQEPFSDTKERLFDEIDASITTVTGAICETGTLILIPDQFEPRTASLVPPIHVALVFEQQLLGSFADFVPSQDKTKMPTNIVLVTGPSKTADIQQTVAYGAHGPKNLVVIFCKNGQDSQR